MLRRLPLVAFALAPIQAFAQSSDFWSVNDVSIAEGLSGTRNLTFNVTLNRFQCNATCTISYATQNGSALVGSDYNAASGSITFTPPALACFSQSQAVNVPIIGDGTSEPHETMSLILSSPVGACSIGDGTGVGTISNDDVVILVNDPSGPETGFVAAPMVPFFVSVMHPSVTAASVSYQTQDGTAIATLDYTARSGSVTIPANTAGVTVQVTVLPDALDEDDETILFNLFNPQGATIGDAQGVGRIIDDDPPPSASINDIVRTGIPEGNAGTTPATFTVSLSAASGRTITIDWATADNTATGGADYAIGSGTLTFAPGVTSQPVSVAVIGDLLDEANELFVVNLTNPVNVTLADGQGSALIVDDDLEPTMTINDVSVTEGGPSTTVNAVFTVSLSAPSSRDVSANWFLNDATALAGSDYNDAEGGVLIPAGQTSYQIVAVVNGDAIDEINETLTADLQGGTNATITDAQGVATIIDDDPSPSASINDVSVNEGSTGQPTPAVFTITLSNPSASVLTLDFATANGTAIAGTDYVAGSGRITFNPGTVSQTVTINVISDLLDEANETFVVNLTNPSVGLSILDNQGVGTIIDDDAGPSIAIDDVAVLEGNAGTINASFTVRLSAASGQTVTVTYASANQTAVAPGDYTAISGNLSFPPGTVSLPVVVSVAGDVIDEVDETYVVNLTSPVNATLGDGQGLGTITDDDAAPAIAVGDTAILEGNTGPVTLSFAVTLSALSGRTITVAWATANGTATAPADYVAASGTATFNPGVIVQTVSITVNGDTLDEAFETVLLDLSAPVNATILDAQGVGTINDDDAPPSMVISDVTILEGNAGTTNAIFDVTLSAASGQVVSVNYATAAGGATAGLDFTAVSGSLTFNRGITALTITVPVLGDTLDELDETFFVDLSGAANANVTDGRGQGTITDDDNPPSITITDVTILEGNAGTTNAVFAVALSAQSGQAVTVDWASANGTAVSPADYTGGSGTLTFTPGVRNQTITIPVAGDLLDEIDETFFINLSNAANAVIADGQGLGTITDDDAPPALSINDVSVSEGNAGSVMATFDVTLSAASGQTVTVDYATANGTAIAPGDYTQATGTLTFGPGVTARTITVTVNGDALDEANETYTVALAGAINASITDGSGLGTITDDDAPPSIAINDASVLEGDTGTRTLTFNVTLSAASGLAVALDYATANGSATAGTDYVAASGRITFNPGVTVVPVAVTINGDTLSEASETFVVNLSNASNGTIQDGQGQGTIVDDDAAPSLFINDVAVSEGNAGTVTVRFDVQLTSASGQNVTVQWSTNNAGAVAPQDYVAGSGTLSFAVGTTSQPVTVTINGDVLDEANETFTVDLSNPVNAPIIDGQGVGTIVDDDGPPSVSISDALVNEGNAGTVNAVFTVTLSAASGQPITIDHATANGTALAGSDYVAGSGRLTFNPGVTAQSVTVQVNGDVLDEANETFTVDLSSPVNVTILDGSGIGTINDDDLEPTVSIGDATVIEGNGPGTVATFTLTLSAASGRATSVDFATANGTALAGTDYGAGSGSVTFTAGVTTRTISLTITGDALDELDETFFVNLTNPGNVVINDGQGLGTITDDDLAPALSIADVAVVEGNAGSVTASFNVTLSAASGLTITVDYSTSNGSAVAPGDYMAASGTLTFAAGVTTQPISVAANGDTLNEIDETFTVNLVNPVRASIADGQGIGTITNDDAVPALAIADAAVTEGNAGTVSMVFTVSLTPASGRTVTVDYATANGSAVAPQDYTAGSGTLTFGPGVTTQSITVAVIGDLLDEANETFTAALSNPVNATIQDGSGVGTITDNDAPPSISIADVAVSEGNTGSVTAIFLVSLSAPSGLLVGVDFATVAGSAVAPGDFVAQSGSLSFAAGVTSQTITIAVNGDTLDEVDETFTVDLTNPTNGTIADPTGIGTITDDDAAPALAIADVIVTEPNTGTVNAVFTVTLSAASGQTVTVDYATANGTASSPADYAAVSGNLTFTPGSTSRTITVAVNGDLLDEIDEAFTVVLSNPTNSLIGDASATCTITDNDAPPSISIADVAVTEGNAGSVIASFNVSLSAASGRTVQVSFATADGAAVAGADYIAALGTLSFAPGVTSLPVGVTVNADVLDEINETFDVVLSGPVNATILDGTGVGTINDDDNPPSISIADASVNEDDAGTVTLSFDVTLSGASGRSLSVDFASANGTAVTPADYAPSSGTLTFAAGVVAQTINVTVAGDTLDEANETLTVTLSNAVSVVIADGFATGVIVDNDAAPSLSINDVTVVEGNAGSLNATFDVTLSAASGQIVTVDWATANDTAVAPGDYAANGATLTFNAGTTSRTFTVAVAGDLVDEANETYFVNLSNSTNAVIADGRGVGTITDNDAPPSLSIADVSIAEGNAGQTGVVFTVSLSIASGQVVTALWATADQTALAGIDYVAASGGLTFAPGVTAQTLTVLVSGDVLDELDEAFSVTLSGEINATLGDGTAVGTITDDDASPTLSVNDVTLLEGTGATQSAVFVVSLSAASARAITVDFATANGTALAGSDYVAGSGTLSFAPGVTTQQVTVSVTGDALDEADETFDVVLSNPTASTVADGTGVGTITDDDAPPSISIADATVTEGDAGTVVATFVATLSTASGRTITAGYATANGTAVVPGDYASASGTLTFAAGATTQSVSVTVNGDTVDEANETFTVTLSAPVNVTVLDGSATGLITDDDGAPQLSIADITVVEGNAGSTNAQLTVTLLPASGQVVTVSWATQDGTAVAAQDYTAGSGSLSFPIGSTQQTITVPILGDVLDEALETFLVNLSGPVNAAISDGQAAVSISDDDAPPALTIADAAIAEGNAGSVALTFTLTLSAASAQTITVDHATADGTAGAADYTPGSGTVTFAAGATSRTITVNVTGDLLDEADETFSVNLTNGTNVTISDGQAIGTINDNDPLPLLAIVDLAVAEGDSGTVDAVFTVTLGAPSGRTVSVAWSTADGTALAGSDYAAGSGVLTFASGVVSQTLTVVVNGDTTNETAETFVVNLASPVNATLGDGQATGTINNDDAAPALAITDASVNEGNSGAVSVTFNVTLAPLSGQTVTVAWATANGAALAGTDYVAGSGTLTFAPGTTLQSLTVAVNGDLFDEVNETFFVNLSAPVNAVIGDAQGAGTINDDDAPPSLSIADASIVEGNTGTTNVTFTVTLSPVSGQAVTVDYATGNGTAVAGSDYATRSGTLTFAAGAVSQTFTVPVTGDVLDELDEQFFVNLTNVGNAVIGDNQAVATITDDDAAPSISIADVAVTEGNAGTVAATLTLSLSAASGQAITVDYATANGTATGADYITGSGTLMFAAGALTQTVVISVNGDTIDEPDETFTVNLSNPTNATLGDATAIGTITDDDAPPALAITDVVVTEPNTGTANAVFTVSLSAASGQTVTVNFATSNGSAVSPADYAALSGTLTFAPGSTSQSITVLVAGDVLDEVDETFSVVLSSPTNSLIGDGSGIGTITDNDAPPSVSIADVAVTEGNTGTLIASFNVTLSAASGRTISVSYGTADGTAVAGADYVAALGALTFGPGVTTLAVAVTVNGDALDEVNETFDVVLSAPSNATILDGAAVGTINDDDNPPSVSIADGSVNEGDAGTVNLAFVVTLAAASGRSLSVDFASANGTAVTPADYAAVSGTLTFAPGTTSQTINVTVAGDVIDEANETLTITLSNAVNVSIADGQATGTIADNDAAPTVSINDVTLVEGDAGSLNATFNVTLSAASGQTATVDFATANGTAVAPGDFVAISGTLTFTAGTTSRTLSVVVNGDLLDEVNETYVVNLSNPSNTVIADGQGVGTITDNDAPPSLSIADVAIAEGNAGPTSANFTVSLSAASGQVVTVAVATADQTATAGADYVAGSGTLTFAAGVTTQAFSVSVTGDVLDELDETFSVMLSGPTNATLGDGTAIGTITDDDAPPSLSIADLSLLEGTGATQSAVFTVSLSAPSARSITVSYATANGTALAGSDYVAGSGSLTFAAGVTAQTLTVSVTGDALDEADETFTVVLSAPVAATLADGTAAGTILDDDAPPAVSIADVTITEGNAGSAVATLGVTLSAASGRTITIAYATVNGTAVAPGDYTSASGTLTFAPGTTSQSVSVTVIGDTLDEANETFIVSLSAPMNVTIGDGGATGTITDDDGAPELAIADITVIEGNAGSTNAQLTVTLLPASGQVVSVNWATQDGTAVAGQDYTAGSGSLTFPVGTTQQTFTVPILGDVVDEALETFLVNLSGAVNATPSDPQAVAGITDDDAPPSLTIGDVAVAEGDAGSVALTFTLALSLASAQTITVDYVSANGTAGAADYTTAAGTISFAAGVTTRTIAVNVTGDLLDEANETFFVNLTNGVNVTIADGQAIGTINDNDPLPSLAIADVAMAEGNAGTGLAVFTVTLSAPSGRGVTVAYATADGTALAGSDYASGSGTLTFAPGIVSQTISVTVNGDATNEINETFLVNLTSPVNATLGDGQATGTITNDDGAPALAIADAAVTEGNAGTVSVAFNVTLAAPSGQIVTVNWATGNGTAIAGSDYIAGSGTLTFAPGITVQSLSVAVSGDVLDEPVETFVVNLTAPTNAVLGDAQGTGTITDDDAPPSLSIADVSIAEGNAGTSNLTFTVTLSAASGQAVTVDYATANSTAIAGSDYVSRTGSLAFAPGTSSQTFTVSITGDVLDEANEQLFVNLTNAVNASIGDNQAIGTITDDDGAPSISIADVAVTEGNVGLVPATFTLTLAAASGLPISVSYATAGGTAVSGVDFVAASGSVSFTPGVISQTIVVSVNADTLDEPDEAFTVDLSSPTNTVIGDGQATGTITDDDGPPLVSIADVFISEGDSGSSDATFTVSIGSSSGQDITVSWSTSDQSALSGADYVAGSGALTFPAGTTSQTFTVAVSGDALDEIDEVFEVQLSNPTNAAIGDGLALGTIIDDDLPPSLVVQDVTDDEMVVLMSFSVSLSAPSGRPISVDYTTADGTAFGGLDYLDAAGTLTFLPGEVLQTIDVTIDDDALDENDETFTVLLANAVNATTARDLALGTILDDDAAPTISIAGTSLLEGDFGGSVASLIVSLSAPSELPIQVAYTTIDGTAAAGQDYAAISGVLDFVPGATAGTVDVTITGDVLDEPDEDLMVSLSGAVNATIAVAMAIIDITDDDLAPDLSLSVSSSAPFTVGQQGSYTFRVENLGAGPTTAPIALVDALPPGLAFAAGAGSGWACSDDQSVVTCTSTLALAPSQASADLVLTVDVAPEAFPQITHTATIATIGDLDPGNDSAPITTEVIGLADLSISKTRPETPAVPGEPVTWTITITNLGPNAVTELFVVDELPRSVSNPTFTTDAGLYDAVSGLLSDISLSSGDSVELSVTALLAETATGTLANRAITSVPSTHVDTDGANDVAVHRSVIADLGACDDDGLSDEEEQALGTDPCNPDTDGDGIVDGIEVGGENPTDPLDPDSDDDGLCDGSNTVEGICIGGEDINDNGRRDPRESDPNDEDTDDGTVGDGAEVLRGTNPLDPDDDLDEGCDCSVESSSRGAGLLWLVFLGLFLVRRQRIAPR